MVGVAGNQTNSAQWFILLRLVGTTYCADSSTVPNCCAKGQIPPKLRCRPTDQYWMPIKDEIRGLTHIPEKGFSVKTCFGYGCLFALCYFIHNDVTREVFSMYVEGFWLRSLANGPG